VKSIQVKHSGDSGREHREIEPEIADWGERERTEIAREYSVSFITRTDILVLADSPKST